MLERNESYSRVEPIMDAKNDGHDHAKTEADVVDKARHLSEVLEFVRLGVDEIPNAADERCQDKSTENDL